MSEKEDDDESLRALIEEALKIDIQTKREYKNHKELSESLSPIISEFLDSFIVLGYDFDGQPLSFQVSPNTQQKDALDTLVLKYFYQRTGGVKDINSGDEV
jgi:hypothetical protein